MSTTDEYYRALQARLDAEFPAEGAALDLSVLRFQLANREKQLREALAEIARLRGEVPLSAPDVEAACEVMHDAYERAASGNGWETNPASRKPWADVPESNKATMRAAVSALFEHLGGRA